MNIAYFGTPQIAAQLLQKLYSIENHKITLVVTQPDKAIGKQLAITPTPVKALAQELHIDVFDNQLTQISERTLIQLIKASEIDIAILFAYGEILSVDLLNAPKYGIWNVHPSLLPLYRGSSPTTFPILMGDSQTGTTLIQMNEYLDQGDIIEQTAVDIQKNDNRATIEDKLISIAAEQISIALEKKESDSIQTKQQDHSSATFTRQLTKQDGFISLELLSRALKGEMITNEHLPKIIRYYLTKNQITPSKSYSAQAIIMNLFRGLSPWPGLWTCVKIGNQEKRLKLIDIQISSEKFQIHTVQLEGKNKVDFNTFNKAYNIFLIN